MATLVAAGLLASALSYRGAVAWLLALGLLAWGMCVATVALAGVILGDLSGTTLLLLSCGWLALAAIVLWRRGAAATTAGLRRSLAATWAAVAWPPAAAATVVVALSLTARTILAVRVPMADVLGWQYHLVFVDVWLQANRIVEVSQNIWTDGWPATGELLTTWLTAFNHSDALTGFTGLLPIPLLVVGCIGLARSLGASRQTALLAGLLLGMTPAMLALAGTTYLDTAFTAAVVATWWYGLRIIGGERDASVALLLGTAAGLALGIKGTGFVLVLPMLVAVGVILVADAIRRGHRGGWWAPWLRVAAAGVPVLLLGASWYLKNLLLHGNPLYPVGIGPYEGLEAGTFGAPPLPNALLGLSPIAEVAVSWAHDWQLADYLYNQRPGGFGHAWLAVLAIAVVGLVLLVRRRAWAAIALVVGPAVLALVLLASPWYARYTLFVPAMALPLVAITLDRLTSALRVAVGFVLVALASISVVLVNAFPNVELPGTQPSLALATTYWGAVLDESAPIRDLLAAPPRCRDDVPDLRPGARVAVESSFFLPHAVVGPDLDRILVEPPPQAEDPASLVSQLRERGATWFVTRRGTPLDALAADAGGELIPRGSICLYGRLWKLSQDPGA